MAAELFVMDLQVLSGTTDLASPTIAAEHLFSELVVELDFQPLARSLGTNRAHEACSVTSFRNAWR